MDSWEESGGQANVKGYPDGTSYDFSAPKQVAPPDSPEYSPDKHASTKYHFNKFMEALFWRTLCPCPDGPLPKLRNWAYNFTGRIAGHFHRKTCTICKGR